MIAAKQTMQVTQIVAPGQSRLIDLDVPTPGPNDVLIEVKRAGVCGTDLHIWHGDYALAQFPLVPGHEFSGVVAAVGAEVKGVRPGDRVTADPNLPCYSCFFCQRKQFNQCLNLEAVGVTRAGAFASYVVVPESAVFNIGAMPFDEAALLEPLACVVWGLKKVQLQAGDSMLIFGAGPMGLLMLQAVKAAGASFATVVDIAPKRLELAQKLGANQTVLASEFNAALAKDLSPYGFDVVADATGVPQVIENAIHYIRAGGKLWVFGVAPEGSSIALPPADIFRQDFSVIGSFALNKTFSEAIALVQHGAVNVRPLVSHQLPLEKFDEALELAEKDPDRMKVQFKLD